MNMQIREKAKTADLKVAYGKDGLDVRVCVMNIEFRITLHTENVHISVDKLGSARSMYQNVNNF
ncbi:hypothetical protein [Butyrivibrio sp.]|uniref:hypothetical protein n=1 Tax=Butyrivibrio sp. TaxID=28121 RepID=UPI0025C137F7|nr:hypothetical protein [Butyrivibrio sp.]MBQ9301515.1 hypothetical protein [Butyrivibrio sp.]